MAEKGKSPRKGGKRGGDKDVVPASSLGGPGGGGETDLTALVQQMMKEPGTLQAMQGHLARLVGKSSGYIESLPEPVQRRIRALKNNQVEIMKIERQFHLELCKLQVSFEGKFQELYSKRKTIVAGEYEPTDEECTWEDDEEDNDEEEKEEEDKDDKKKEGEEGKPKDEGTDVDGVEDKEKYGEEKPKEAAAEKDVKGIPHFWLTAMKNVELFDPLIKEWDNPALEKLTDIRVVYPEDSGLDFILEFHFDENDYFTQRVLTKKYKIKCDVDPDSPFSFEGPEIILSEGCKISWKDNKNLTLKTVKKTQKHKSKGQTRTVTKTVHQESFFDFFNGVPERTDDDDDEEEEQGDVRELDFARGEFFRDSFIQKAVLFFTGEIENDDDDYDDEDEDYLNDEDYNEEGDPDFVPAIGPGGEGKPAECKQQ